MPTRLAQCLFLCIAALLAAQATAAAPAEQDDWPTAEEILDAFVLATGGKDAYANLENRVEELTVEPVGSGLTIPMKAYYARPDRTYFLIEGRAIGKIERGTTGGVAWEVSSAGGPVVEEGTERERSLRAGTFDRLCAWRELFTQVECTGVETLAGNPCYRVVLTPATGTPETHYYDRESGLLRKVEWVDDEHTPFQLLPGDYREVDGVLFPHVYRRVGQGQEVLYTVKSLRNNVDIPAERFALPDAIQALLEGDDTQLGELHLQSFDRVWSIVNDHYWDPEFGGLDWQAVREELRPRIQAASNRAEVRALLGEMIARLGVSHFGIVPGKDTPPADPQPRRSEGPGGETGIDARVIEGRALVTSVAEGSTAERAGVRAGWEILRIEDFDVSARLEELAATLPDTPSKRVKMAGEVVIRVRSGAGTSLAVTFRDGEGERVELAIPFGAPRGRLADVGNFGQARVRVDVESLDGNIGYIAVNKFLDPAYVMKTFNAAMESFQGGAGVVLDLRGNGGGKDLIAMLMLGWLAPEEYVAGRIRMRAGETPMTVRPRSTTYDGPLAVLTDGLTGSSAEFVAAALQETGRACIIGTRTKGEALPAQYITLPNGDVFLFAVADFVTGAGQRLEGIGVTPDIEVALTRASLLDGRDLVLEAAVAWVREQD